MHLIWCRFSIRETSCQSPQKCKKTPQSIDLTGYINSPNSAKSTPECAILYPESRERNRLPSDSLSFWTRASCGYGPTAPIPEATLVNSSVEVGNARRSWVTRESTGALVPDVIANSLSWGTMGTRLGRLDSGYSRLILRKFRAPAKLYWRLYNSRFGLVIASKIATLDGALVSS